MKSSDYFSFEEVSPYSNINEARLSNVKQNFRAGAKVVRDYSRGKNNLKILDVGCANGEFLHYLMASNDCSDIAKCIQSAVGIDMTPKFIETANTLRIDKTQFLCGDIFKFSGNPTGYNIITCFGTVPIFKNPQPFFSKLYSLLGPDGILICDGLYNKYNVSVEIRFKDDSVKPTMGVWRSDFNQPRYSDIQDIFKALGTVANFIDIDFCAHIPQNASAPAVNVWTQVLKNETIQVVNGLNMIINPTLLTVTKKILP